MIFASWKKYQLNFIEPAGTSRGILLTKTSYFIFLVNVDEPAIFGIGECGLLSGLSYDDKPEYEEMLSNICDAINTSNFNFELLLEWPSIRFGYEMATIDLKNGGNRILFPSEFTEKNALIKINGLIWMERFENMKLQIENKIAKGFDCIKLKIGAIVFEDEIELLKKIRKQFSKNDIEIRLDANGAFHKNEAFEKLKILSAFDIHSIEQPIKQNQIQEMAALCKNSPIDIALDEELIGIHSTEQKLELLLEIKPQYIILKPSFLGGYDASSEWIKIAEAQKIKWWITSALESNIGLNAIAQWTYTLGNKMPQGLGTGQLYSNNFNSPLNIENGNILYNSKNAWILKSLFDAK
jgi:o-succinylbenzoate synthase